MNRASSATGWVRNPIMKSPELDPKQASSYELGWTTNPITGCLNGCPYCYAMKLANGRLKQRYLANKNYAPPTENVLLPNLGFYEHDPFYPRFWPERILDVRLRHEHNKQCKGIFVCDMGELFGDWIPEEWQRLVFNAIKACPQHRFYLLTKQPQNLIKFSLFSENCWVGVTATNYEMYKDAKWYLNRIEAKIKYISFEPLLERIGMHPPIGIDWAIIGAQTKPYKPPKKEWIDDLLYLLDRYQIPVFLKNNLKPLLGLNLRQEMPKEVNDVK